MLTVNHELSGYTVMVNIIAGGMGKFSIHSNSVLEAKMQVVKIRNELL